MPESKGEPDAKALPNDNATEVRLLHDDPAEDDHFGGHDDVAAAVADMIRREDKSVPFSLVGPWGSGKTTTIKLIVSKLQQESSDTFRAFVFDAWGHQGDSLRRAFLEDLASTAKREEWVPPESFPKLDAACASLAQRHRRHLTRHTPQSPISALLFWVSILALPLAYLVLQQDESGNTSIWALLLLMAPIAVVTLHVIVGMILFFLRPTAWGRKLRGREVIDAHTAFGEQPLRSAARLVKSIDPETEGLHIDEVEASSLEFQRQFYLICKEISGDSYKKLLVVVDNLDRLDPNSAVKLWANLRVFFESTTSDAWVSLRKRIWLCIAYDKIAMFRAFEKSQLGNDEAFEGFCDKTFQISYRVPPVLLADWKRYMDRQLQHSLPALSEGMRQQVIRVYDSLRETREVPPTPRSIIRFINDLGGVHRQWGVKVPAQVEAVYVMRLASMKPDIARRALRTMDSKLIGGLPVGGFEDRDRYLLAAMYFGVSEGRARQFLLPYDIERAALSGNPAEMSALADVTGFSFQFERVVDDKVDDWADQEGASKLFRFAKLLASLTILSESTAKDTWKLIEDRAMRLNEVRVGGSGEGEGIAALIRRCSSDRESLCRRLVRLLSMCGPVSNADDSVQKWAHEVGDLLNDLYGDYGGVIAEEFELNVLLAQYSIIAAELRTKCDWESLKVLRMKSSEESKRATEELLGAVKDMKLDEQGSIALAALMLSRSISDAGSVVSQISNVLRYEQKDVECAARLIEVLAAMHQEKEAHSALQRLGRGHSLHHWAHVCQNTNRKHVVDLVAIVYGSAPDQVDPSSRRGRQLNRKSRPARAHAHHTADRFNKATSKTIASKLVSSAESLKLRDELEARANSQDGPEAEFARRVLDAMA